MADPSLVLAGISLAFQVFSGCIVAFQLLADALHFYTNADRYLAYLRLQEFLLFTFARQAGIIDGRREYGLDYDKISDALGHIELLLTDVEGLKNRYGMELSTSPSASTPEVQEKYTPDLEFLFQGNFLQERKQILANAT